jgi:hypothetical protein
MFLRSRDANHVIDEMLLRFLFNLPHVYENDELALTVAVLSNPRLTSRLHQLQDRKIYGKYSAIVRRNLPAKEMRTISRHRMSDETIAAIREVLAVPGDGGITILASGPTFTLWGEPGTEDVGG